MYLTISFFIENENYSQSNIFEIYFWKCLVDNLINWHLRIKSWRYQKTNMNEPLRTKNSPKWIANVKQESKIRIFICFIILFKEKSHNLTVFAPYFYGLSILFYCKNIDQCRVKNVGKMKSYEFFRVRAIQAAKRFRSQSRIEIKIIRLAPIVAWNIQIQGHNCIQIE